MESLGRSAGASQDSPEGERPAQSCWALAQGRASWATDLDLPAFAVTAEPDASADKQALDSGAASCRMPPERGGHSSNPDFCVARLLCR